VFAARQYPRENISPLKIILDLWLKKGTAEYRLEDSQLIKLSLYAQEI
jgi:hypothetical protein